MDQKGAKRVAGVWAAVGTVLTAVAGLAFVNNVSVVVRWWKAFRDADGNSALLPSTCSGVLPAFDWACVDYSCVTTFVPFLGLLLLTAGLFRIARGRARAPDDEAFPFFPAYDQLNISLGLVGTLWGIIVIGYYDMSSVSMSDLMMCLHTALFSTLMAVVWVFLVDHPLLRPWVRGLAETASGRRNSEDEDADFLALVAQVETGLRGVGKASEEQKEGLRVFSEALSAAGAEVAKFREAGEALQRVVTVDIPEAVAKMGGSIEEVGKQMEARQAAFESSLGSEFEKVSTLNTDACQLLSGASQAVGTLQSVQRSIAEAATRLMGDNARLGEELAAERKSANEIRGQMAGVQSELSVRTERLERLQFDFQKSAEMHEAEMKDVRARLEKLSEQKAALDTALAEARQAAAEAKTRADRAEKKLEKMRSLFSE